MTVEYCVVLSEEQAALVAFKADINDVICDLEYLENEVKELIDSWGDKVPPCFL